MGNTVAMSITHTNTFYTVESYSWYEPIHGQGRWIASGSGGMYNTIPKAHIRVKEDLKRAMENKCDLSKIKFRIVKVVNTESTEEELTGSDFTALMLKTA